MGVNSVVVEEICSSLSQEWFLGGTWGISRSGACFNTWIVYGKGIHCEEGIVDWSL